MRTPEMLARAILRARESLQNKENIVPVKPGSRRRRRRVSTSRSPLPADYPRAPLQDITVYIHALQRSRTRARTRMQTHRLAPARQLMIRDSPVQESPLQETETTVTVSPRTDLQQETQLQNTSGRMDSLQQETVITEPSILVGRVDSLHQETVITETSILVDTMAAPHQDNQVQNSGPMRNSSLSNSTSSRVFGTVLESENEINGRDPESFKNRPVSKKAPAKNSIKPLMKMR
eukprot:Gb_40695 [translate_table: standard]